MGTTAEKLKYLNETKAEIKNALETPYNVMRDYPELIKKYIDNQPTKVVTDGICENAVDVPVKVIEINGNIRHETTEGKNKLDFKKILKSANVTYTEQDGVFSLAKTGSLYAVPYKLDLKPNTTYTIYQNFQEQNSTNVRLTIARGSKYEKVVESYSTTETESYRKKTFTTDENSDYYIRGDWSLSYFPLIYNKPILIEGTEDIIHYEPYTGGIPSPNPDYKQEITSVGGYDNIFDKNNIISGSYVSDSNGTFVSNSTSKRTDYIEIQANSYYYIYSDKTSGNWGAWYDKDKKFISGITLGGQKEGVVNSPANAKYIAFTISYQGNLTDYSKIKINETAIKIKHSGKNLFNFNGVTNPSIATYESGIATLTWDRGYNVYFLSNSRQKLTDIDSKKTYTVIFKHKGNSIKMFNYATSQYGVSTKDDNEYAEYKFIITGVDFIELNAIRIATSGTAYIKEIMLYEGTDEASYESYHEPIITPINLQGNILSKVRDVKDILKVNRNGEVEIKKNTWEETINTSSLITLSNNNKGFVFTTSKKKATGGGNDNYLVTNAQRNQTRNDGTVYQNPANFVFVGNSTDTLETIKAKFNGGKILYQLATPQTIRLPSISPIELWQGTNIFKLITNLDTDFEVEYVVDKDSVTKEEE